MRAAAAADRRPALPPRPAADVAHRRRAPQPVERSSPRSALRAPAPRPGRSRPPAALAVNPRGNSSNASGFPRVSAMIRSRTRSSSLNRTRRAQQRAGIAVAQAAHLQLGHVLEAPRPARALRTRSPPAQRAGGERQTPASAPKPDPATAHHRRHTAADAAPPLPRTNSTPPTRRETGPARPRRSARTRSPARDAAEPAAPRCDRATVRTTDASWRTRAPSPTPPPPPVRPLRSDADATRYSNSAVFPIPASPRSTSDRLSPRRIAETKSSSNAHSLVRPRKPPGGPGTWRPLSISSASVRSASRDYRQRRVRCRLGVHHAAIGHE